MGTESPLADIGLWSLVQSLRDRRWVDLTHTFSATIPHHPSFRPAEFTRLFDHEDLIDGKRVGCRAHEYRFAGQWGTHVDPPIHYHAGLRTQDEIPVAEKNDFAAIMTVNQKIQRLTGSSLALQPASASRAGQEAVHGV